jgi:hypothetical protein
MLTRVYQSGMNTLKKTEDKLREDAHINIMEQITPCLLSMMASI